MKAGHEDKSKGNVILSGAVTKQSEVTAPVERSLHSERTVTLNSFSCEMRPQVECSCDSPAVRHTQPQAKRSPLPLLLPNGQEVQT